MGFTIGMWIGAAIMAVIINFGITAISDKEWHCTDKTHPENINEKVKCTQWTKNDPKSN